MEKERNYLVIDIKEQSVLFASNDASEANEMAKHYTGHNKCKTYVCKVECEYKIEPRVVRKDWDDFWDDATPPDVQNTCRTEGEKSVER